MSLFCRLIKHMKLRVRAGFCGSARNSARYKHDYALPSINFAPLA
jgi:hypothetical protein